MQISSPKAHATCIMLPHTSTSVPPAWCFISALAATAALLPAGAMAASPQHVSGIAEGTAAHDFASAGQLAGLEADLYGGFISPGRDLLMRGKKGKGKKGKGKKGKGKKGEGKKGKGRKGKGKKGKGKGEGKKGEGRDGEGEVQCTLTAAVEEVEVYDAEFLHASASAPLPSCLPPQFVQVLVFTMHMVCLSANGVWRACMLPPHHAYGHPQ